MSTIQQIKGIRDELAKDVSAAKKTHEKMENDLRGLTATVKATEATIEAKVRFLANLDAILRETDNLATATRKPGPKPKAQPVKATVAPAPKTATAKKATPKAQPTVVQAQPVKAKPGPKPKAQPVKAQPTVAKATVTKTKTATKAQAKNRRSHVAEGRRAVAEGLRPPIKDAMQKIIGSKTMTIDEIFEGLKAKNWLPNSNEPRQYIAYLLSTSKERFERVASAGRGVYRVKPGVTAAPAPKTKANKAEGNGGLTTDEILANSGVLESTFGG